MTIKLCVDEHTGEPFLTCHYNKNGGTDDQVMRRLERLLLNRKLKLASSGGSSEGDGWFAVTLEQLNDTNVDSAKDDDDTDSDAYQDFLTLPAQ